MSVAIIGCGSCGSAIGCQLSIENVADRIKLVDSNYLVAKKLSKELERINPKIFYEPFQADIKFEKDINELVEDVEIVINAASPICNIPLMKACIKSSSHYIDLASDPFNYENIPGETSLHNQLRLDDHFRKKDLVAITNAGASPGFSDILSKHASDSYSFTRIHEIKIYFTEIIVSEKLVTSWSPYILLLESLLPATIYKDKAIHELESNKRHKNINFPQPFGKKKVTLFNGHPELKTIPDFIGLPVDYIEVGGSMSLNKMNLNDILLELLRKRVKESLNIQGDIFEFLASSFESTDLFVENFKKGVIKKEKLCCLTEIVGVSEHVLKRYNASTKIDLSHIIKKNPLATATSYMVSVLPTILTSKLIEDQITERGVIAPAALNSSSEIVDEAKKFDINFVESIEEII